jgi:flagellar biosynthetic protein FlhB
MGRFFFEQASMVMRESLTGFIIDSARNGDWRAAVMFAFEKSFLILGPLFGMFLVLSFASTVVQIGFLVNEEALKPKVEKLNPVEGFKRIFSMRSLVEGLKAVIKVLLIGLLAAAVVKSEILTVPTLIHFSVSQIFSYFGDVVLKLLGAVGIFMVFLAGLDYMFQRYDLEKKMKMTKQEVKEEHKSREGDPLVKARIRRVQREMANKRMMEDVPKADVIVTNPTHIAVALKYTAGQMAAPKIVAMGAGVIAEKIKALGRENNVPVVENKPLARTMFKTLKIGQTIPRELFAAVAEVLTYVYRLKKKVV